MSNLSFEVDAIDKVPEAARGFYEEKDGKFRLKVDGIEDTSGLKTALQRERENAAKAKEFMKLGKTPEEIADLVRKADEFENNQAIKAGEFEKLRAKISEKHSQELDGIRQEMQLIAKSEAEARIQNNLMTALTKAGATSEGLAILPNIMLNRARIETVDGNRVVRILDAGGTPMIGTGGKDAGFDDLAAEAVKNFPSLFQATGKGGSGKPPSSGGAGSGTGRVVSADTLSKMTPVEKAKYFRENPGVTVST